MLERTKWTEDKIQLLCDLKKSHTDWLTISEKLQFSVDKCKSYFYKIRKKYNLPYNLDKYNAEEIKLYYKEYGHRKTLKKYGTYAVKFIQKHHNHHCNLHSIVENNVSDFLKTPDFYYFAGLVAADGNVICEKRNCVRIGLKISDVGLLEIIKSKIGGTIYFRPDGTAAEWSIHDKKLLEKMLLFNICPNKSLKLLPPNSNLFPTNKSLIDFIRGYFDGDGCVSMSYNKMNKKGEYPVKPFLGFYGTEKFLNWIMICLNHLFGTKTRSTSRSKSIRSLNYGAVLEWDVILNGFYSLGESDIFLDRKKKMYLQIRNLLPKLKKDKINE